MDSTAQIALIGGIVTVVTTGLATLGTYFAGIKQARVASEAQLKIKQLEAKESRERYLWELQIVTLKVQRDNLEGVQTNISELLNRSNAGSAADLRMKLFQLVISACAYVRIETSAELRQLLDHTPQASVTGFADATRDILHRASELIAEEIRFVISERSKVPESALLRAD